MAESAIDLVKARADEVESLLHVDPAAAEALAHETIFAAAGAGLAEIQGRLTYALARVRAERGDPHEALRLIDEARTIWHRGGFSLLALRTDLGRMQILDDLGRHEESLAVGQAMLAGLADEDGDPQLVATLRAAALGNVGVAHSFLGSHDESRSCYDQSAAIYAELGMPIQVAQQRANSGIELLALGRARDALAALLRSEQEFRDGVDPLWAAKCSAHVADAHRQLGDVVPALAALHRAGAELLALGAVAEEARVHLQLGRVYLEAGLVPEAIDSARRARALFESAAMSHDAAFARLVLASAHLQGKHLDAAEDEARASVREFEAVGDQQFRGRATLLAAQVAHARSDPRAAQLLDHAVTLLAAGGWTLPLAWAQVEVAGRGGPGADAALTAATSLAEQLMVPDLTHAVALVDARKARRAGRLREAITGLRRCVDDVDLRGRALVDPLLRLASANEATSAHDLLIDMLVERGEPGDAAAALAVSDAAKSQILREVASAPHAEGAWGSTVPAPEADQVIRDLHATYTALSSAERAADRDRLLGDARALEGRLGGLRLQAVAARSSEMSDAGPGGREEPLVGPAVSFHVVEDDVIAFVVRPDSEVTAYRLDGAVARCDRLMRQLSAQWDRFAVGDEFTSRHLEALERTTRTILTDLHGQLLGPISEELDALPGTDLTVVPHRQLHRVPFAALHDGIAPMCAAWTLTLAPLCPRAPAAEVVTDILPADEDTLLVLAVADERAPLVDEEADMLGIVYGNAQVLRGPDATRAALRGAVPGPAIIHLACHGLHRPDNPLFSGLQLGDSWLTCTDLMSMDLSGALVVMSSCGSGEVGHGTAEPVGLAWAALAAGARGVLVSQWVLDDAAALDLMTGIYRRLRKGAPAPSALRAAQLEVARTRPHPYHWAPMTFIAPPRPSARPSPRRAS